MEEAPVRIVSEDWSSHPASFSGTTVPRRRHSSLTRIARSPTPGARGTFSRRACAILPVSCSSQGVEIRRPCWRSPRLLLAATGLPLPIPATMVFPGMTEAGEDQWQEMVIRHLSLPDWQRLRLNDELDLIGPIAGPAAPQVRPHLSQQWSLRSADPRDGPRGNDAHRRWRRRTASKSRPLGGLGLGADQEEADAPE